MHQSTTSLPGQEVASAEPLHIGNKTVFLSRPYKPGAVKPLVGRRQELKLISAAWLAGVNHLPLSPLLLGEPGVGKNRIVYELSTITGRDVYIFQGHEDVTAEDLACSVRFSDDPSRKMDYVLSALVTAMLNGGICFIDEIAKIRPRALALLVSVLDERRYIDSTLLGERIQAKPGFRFIAATNTADLEGQAMPEFLRSRMRPVVQVGYPSRAEVDDIIRARHGGLEAQLTPLLDMFWERWNETHKDEPRPPSPRDVIYAFDLAVSLSDFEALEKHDDRSLRALHSNIAAPVVPPEMLKMAFDELFVRSRSPEV
jgi:MoxR-like ATPase